MPHIPDETLDHIFSFIDDREDLLPILLTSKRFASIGKPHLQFRVIRCTLGTTDLWNHLSEHKVLAQNVRTLEIQRQLKYLYTTFDLPIVPRDFVANAHNPTNRKFYHSLPKKDLPRIRKAERALIRAIKNMSNLKSFKWDRCAPLLDSKLDEDVHDDLWTALATGCPALEELSVMDASENVKDHTYIRPVHHSAMWKLPQNLKVFEYHSYAYRHIARRPPVDELTALLRRCSNLEVLRIGFTLYSVEETEDGDDVSSADLNELLATIHWPKLHTFRTFSVHVSPSTAAGFFRSHPTLVKLQIVENTDQAKFIKDETSQWDPDVWRLPDPDLTLWPGSLPNLVEIDVPKYISKAIDAARVLPTVPSTQGAHNIPDFYPAGDFMASVSTKYIASCS